MVTFIIAAAVGVLIGLLSGLLGIGGGTVMVPIFRLGFGMQAIQATATSLFTIIPTSLAGCVTHLRNKTCVPRLGLAAGIGGACTSPVGVWLASLSPSWAIMLATAIIIAYSAVTMLRKAHALPSGKAVDIEAHSASQKKATEGESASAASSICAPATAAATASTSACAAPASQTTSATANAAAAAPAATGIETPVLSRSALFKGALIGLAAGLASGYVGVGGGFIMVPLFISLLGLPMKLTSGTSLIAVTILAIPGTAEHLMMGNVDVVAGIAMAVGSIPGALVGAQFVKKIPERTLRYVFGIVLLVTAVILVVNEFVPGLA